MDSIRPLKVMGEPFKNILIVCAGPFPQTKSGHAYLLMFMWAATMYPKAIPLRSMRTRTIGRAHPDLDWDVIIFR